MTSSFLAAFFAGSTVVSTALGSTNQVAQDGLIPQSNAAYVRGVDSVTGEEIEGAEVWIQVFDFLEDRLKDPTFLGRTPMKAKRLPVGDTRLWVIDRERLRYSEQRVYLGPSEKPPLIGFLRSSSATVKNMVNVPDQSIPFGAPTKVPNHRLQSLVDVTGFWMDRRLVTYQRFSEFYRWTESHRSLFPNSRNPVHAPPHMESDGSYPPQLDNAAVIGVRFIDAVMFANWEGKRLPTDLEWEAAARGSGNRKYAWGNDWSQGQLDSTHSIYLSNETSLSPLPPGEFGDVEVQSRVSPNGIFELTGNYAQWVEDLYMNHLDETKSILGIGENALSVMRCIRGPSYPFVTEGDAQSAYARNMAISGSAPYYVSFRCAKSRGVPQTGN